MSGVDDADVFSRQCFPESKIVLINKEADAFVHDNYAARERN